MQKETDNYMNRKMVKPAGWNFFSKILIYTVRPWDERFWGYEKTCAAQICTTFVT